MLRSIVLYTALSLFANTVAAADLSAYRTGAMDKLVVFDKPLPVPDLPFNDETGAMHSLADFRGKVVLVNFWATWCVPCREEMPTLNALQREMGGDDFAVVTIASGRNPQGQIDRFFKQSEITDLPRYQDESQRIARGMGIIGLPVSVLIDTNGHEVARLIGEADWNDKAAHDLIKAVIASK